MSFDHWPQWLVLSSLIMRAIMCLVGTISGQNYIRVPIVVISIYTLFLAFCLWQGGYWRGTL